MWYVSGNRDDEVIDVPTNLLLIAVTILHLGFGIHRCMGNRLAEMQLRTVQQNVDRTRPRENQPGCSRLAKGHADSASDCSSTVATGDCPAFVARSARSKAKAARRARRLRSEDKCGRPDNSTRRLVVEYHGRESLRYQKSSVQMRETQIKACWQSAGRRRRGNQVDAKVDTHTRQPVAKTSNQESSTVGLLLSSGMSLSLCLQAEDDCSPPPRTSSTRQHEDFLQCG